MRVVARQALLADRELIAMLRRALSRFAERQGASRP